LTVLSIASSAGLPYTLPPVKIMLIFRVQNWARDYEAVSQALAIGNLRAKFCLKWTAPHNARTRDAIRDE